MTDSSGKSSASMNAGCDVHCSAAVAGGDVPRTIIASYICYRSLGTDLLPAMDEGGFILDYVMPPGSSLQETNRVVSHMEGICRALPEVESTSRRTGMQLGLASVTEANTGDISVKLKEERHRGIDEIISQVRLRSRKKSRKLTSSSPRSYRHD